MRTASGGGLKRKKQDLHFPFPLPAASNADVIAGSGAALLDHEEEATGWDNTARIWKEAATLMIMQPLFYLEARVNVAEK